MLKWGLFQEIKGSLAFKSVLCDCSLIYQRRSIISTDGKRNQIKFNTSPRLKKYLLKKKEIPFSELKKKKILQCDKYLKQTVYLMVKAWRQGYPLLEGNIILGTLANEIRPEKKIRKMT